MDHERAPETTSGAVIEGLSPVEPKHTPGPWNYCQESVDPEWWIVTIQGGLIVANVNAHFCQEANARLIAAAPDMLAACNDCLENRGDWSAAMFAAVAKATGGAS